MELMADFNQGLHLGEALQRCHMIDDLGLAWIEEPIGYDNLDGYAQLTAELKTPIQIGENFYGPRDLQPHCKEKRANLSCRISCALAVCRRIYAKIVELAKLSKLGELLRWVIGDGCHSTGMTVHVDEGPSLNTVLPFPPDRECGVGVLDVDRFGFSIAGQPRGQVIEGIEQPRISGFGREKNQLANGDDALVVLGSPTLNVVDLIGNAKTLAVHHTFALSPFDLLSTCPACRGAGHGTLHPVIRPLAGVRLSLLRPHRHSRLPDAALPARARGLLPSRGHWRPGDHQGDFKRAHQPLPELGGGLRPQSSHPH